MEFHGMHGEAVPFRSELDEQVVQDCIGAQPGLAIRLVRIAFCLAPFDVGIHHAEHSRNVPPAEGIIYVSRQLHIVHHGPPSLRLPCTGPYADPTTLTMARA